MAAMKDGPKDRICQLFIETSITILLLLQTHQITCFLFSIMISPLLELPFDPQVLFLK